MTTGNIPSSAKVAAMSDQQRKIRENRLRRAATRRGLRLEKSRARDPYMPGYGTYCLIDWRTHALVAGDAKTGYGLDLDDVARYLYREC